MEGGGGVLSQRSAEQRSIAQRSVLSRLLYLMGQTTIRQRCLFSAYAGFAYRQGKEAVVEKGL